MVDAAAEGDVAARVTGHVESMRVGEDRGVAVGGAQHHHDLVAGPHAVAHQVEILGRDALGDLHRAVEAQQFVNGLGDQIGAAAQQRQLVGRAQQGQHAVADQVHRGLVTGDQ